MKKTSKKTKQGGQTENQPKFDKAKIFPLEEAIALIKKTAKAKFDESVEAHIRLGIDPKKSDQQVRAAVSLPHGTGKILKVAAFVSPEKEKEVKAAGADLVGGEDLIAEIKKTEKTNFAVAVAEPEMMKKLAPIAKVLGTRGLMPSPKNDTVTANPAKAVAELKKGKASFKSDDSGNLHALIGKISFPEEKLKENFIAFLEAVKKAKPAGAKGIYIKSASLCSTMGSGIKIEIS